MTIPVGVKQETPLASTTVVEAVPDALQVHHPVMDFDGGNRP